MSGGSEVRSQRKQPIVGFLLAGCDSYAFPFECAHRQSVTRAHLGELQRAFCESQPHEVALRFHDGVPLPEEFTIHSVTFFDDSLNAVKEFGF